jgi:hypothetical protein
MVYVPIDPSTLTAKQKKIDPRGIAAWWRKYKDKFPLLYQLYLKYHCAPGSQASEERHISAFSLVFSPLRKSLKPALLDAILLLKINRTHVKYGHL